MDAKSQKHIKKGYFFVEILKFIRDNPGKSIEDIKNAFPKSRQNDIQKSLELNLIGVIDDKGKVYLSIEDEHKLLQVENNRKSSNLALIAIIIAILIPLLMFSIDHFIFPQKEVVCNCVKQSDLINSDNADFIYPNFITSADKMMYFEENKTITET